MKKLPKIGDRVKLKSDQIGFSEVAPGQIAVVSAVKPEFNSFSVNGQNTLDCKPSYWIKMKPKMAEFRKSQLAKAWNKAFYGQQVFVDVAEASGHFHAFCRHLGLDKKKSKKKEYIISKELLEAISGVSMTVGDEVMVVIKDE